MFIDVIYLQWKTSGFFYCFLLFFKVFRFQRKLTCLVIVIYWICKRFLYKLYKYNLLQASLLLVKRSFLVQYVACSKSGGDKHLSIYMYANDIPRHLNEKYVGH